MGHKLVIYSLKQANWTIKQINGRANERASEMFVEEEYEPNECCDILQNMFQTNEGFFVSNGLNKKWMRKEKKEQIQMGILFVCPMSVNIKKNVRKNGQTDEPAKRK